MKLYLIGTKNFFFSGLFLVLISQSDFIFSILLKKITLNTGPFFFLDNFPDVLFSLCSRVPVPNVVDCASLLSPGPSVCPDTSCGNAWTAEIRTDEWTEGKPGVRLHSISQLYNDGR